VRRLLDFVLRNWPLKLAAIGLATVLYAGVTLSGNEHTWPGAVPIEVLDPPPGAAVLDLPGSVTSIRYRAPIEASSQLTNGSFLASIDLGNVTPTSGGPPVPVNVRVTAVDPRVQVIDFTPRSVNVRVDQVVSRPMSVTVDRGTVPDGLTLGAPQVSPATVVVRGASSRVAAVQSVVARVAVDASGLNVDQDVDLEATDETGAQVPGVELIPQRVHVRIDVARELAYATLPVVPVLSGAPAPGYRVSSVRADPQTLTVSGEAAAVERLSSISTLPLDISGVTGDVDRTVDPDLPADVSLVAGPGVRLVVTVEPDVGSRTWQVGVQAQGARASRQYVLSTPTVLVTMSGVQPDLDAVDPSTIDAHIAVGRLAPGTHEVDVVVEPLDGLDLVSVAPATIRVDVSVPEATGSPVPSVPAGPAGPSASTTPQATSVPTASSGGSQP
jgi:YbbR domain-containing protein